MSERLPGPLARGVVFGLAVWTGSYLGWLPAAGIIPPATRWRWRRNAMMIAAHVVWVWGGATAVMEEELKRSGQDQEAGTLPNQPK